MPVLIVLEAIGGYEVHGGGPASASLLGVIVDPRQLREFTWAMQRPVRPLATKGDAIPRSKSCRTAKALVPTECIAKLLSLQSCPARKQIP
jgi:hypothetical protein